MNAPEKTIERAAETLVRGWYNYELAAEAGDIESMSHRHQINIGSAQYNTKYSGTGFMVSTISCQEFAPLSKQGGFDMIDVRTRPEFYQVHAVGALCVPLDTLNPELIMASRGDRAKEPLYVICKSGGRSAEACDAFVSAGFDNVVNIEGGTMAWLAAGLPVNRGTKKMMSLERQVRIFAGVLIVAGTLLAIRNPWFLAIPGIVGAGLVFAGWSNACGMGMILAKMPWNKSLQGQACSGSGGCSGGGCPS